MGTWCTLYSRGGPSDRPRPADGVRGLRARDSGLRSYGKDVVSYSRRGSVHAAHHALIARLRAEVEELRKNVAKPSDLALVLNAEKLVQERDELRFKRDYLDEQLGFTQKERDEAHAALNAALIRISDYVAERDEVRCARCGGPNSAMHGLLWVNGTWHDMGCECPSCGGTNPRHAFVLPPKKEGAE